MLFTPSTATTLVQATVISYLDHGHSLLTALFARPPVPCPLKSVYIAARRILSFSSSPRAKAKIHTAALYDLVPLLHILFLPNCPSFLQLQAHCPCCFLGETKWFLSQALCICYSLCWEHSFPNSHIACHVRSLLSVTCSNGPSLGTLSKIATLLLSRSTFV